MPAADASDTYLKKFATKLFCLRRERTRKRGKDAAGRNSEAGVVNVNKNGEEGA